MHLRTAVEKITADGITAGGRNYSANYYVSAVPFERADILPDERVEFEHSPITGIHIWFDKPVTDLPHATLLDRTLQWMFNKDGGRYLQLVVSASRSLVRMDRNDVLQLALRELSEFFPAVQTAGVQKFHVVKEVRATFSATPGLSRPSVRTQATQRFSRRRLGRFRVAGHYGRRGSQRIYGGRSCYRRGRISAILLTTRHSLKSLIIGTCWRDCA